MSYFQQCSTAEKKIMQQWATNDSFSQSDQEFEIPEMPWHFPPTTFAFAVKLSVAGAFYMIINSAGGILSVCHKKTIHDFRSVA